MLSRCWLWESPCAVEEITREACQIPFSTRVDSVTNFQSTLANEDDLVVEDLVDGSKDFAGTDLERVKRISSSNFPKI